MASITRQEQIDAFREIVNSYEPYPLDLYNGLGFDDKRCPDDKRFAATISLKALLDLGFSEDEVNPWKNKH